MRENLREMQHIIATIESEYGERKIPKCAALDELYVGLIFDELECIETNYNLAVTVTLADYYSTPALEESYTKDYYRIITSDNIMAQIDNIVSKCRLCIASLYKINALGNLPKDRTRKLQSSINSVSKSIEYAQSIEINIRLERNNYEICKCGVRMTIMPELSEMHCDRENGGCGKIKSLWGVVFRDDQFYPQDGQKNKHGGYDTGRHYRFWIERIMTLENKIFPEEDSAKIDYVLNRDKIDRRDLNIVIMRAILKETKLTKYNDHCALLVVLHGGPAPPRLDFQENRKMSNRFHMAMTLYDQVVPNGGNKPYYPYFIYKIIEHEFRDDPEKLRLLDYIHLQSRDTVVKNDEIFQKMCKLSASDKNGFKYMPTDPAGRI